MITQLRVGAALAIMVFLYQPLVSQASAQKGGNYLWAERLGSMWTMRVSDKSEWRVAFECSDTPCNVPPQKWPKQLQTKPPISILTPKGVESATLDSLQINVVGGLEMVCAVKAPSPAAAKSAALARTSPDLSKRGLARVGKPFSSGAHLRSVSQDATLPATLTKALEGLHASIEREMSKKSKTFAKLQIKSQDYSIASFKSSRGKLWLVWFSYEKYQNRRQSAFPESVDEVSFAFAAIVGDNGAVLETIMPPKLGMSDSQGEWKPIFFADLSGTGAEDIVADKSYYEGSMYMMYSLKKSSGVVETLLLHHGS
jgi:hypothetical protein